MPAQRWNQMKSTLGDLALVGFTIPCLIFIMAAQTVRTIYSTVCAQEFWSNLTLKNAGCRKNQITSLTRPECSLTFLNIELICLTTDRPDWWSISVLVGDLVFLIDNEYNIYPHGKTLLMKCDKLTLFVSIFLWVN